MGTKNFSPPLKFISCDVGGVYVTEAVWCPHVLDSDRMYDYSRTSSGELILPSLCNMAPQFV